MKLKSNKIYKWYPWKTKLMLPTLSIKGNAEVYMSLSNEKPSSKNEMIKIEGFKSDCINSVIGMIRWICVVYELESEVNDCGLVSDPYSCKTDVKPYIPVPATIGKNIYMAIDSVGHTLLF